MTAIVLRMPWPSPPLRSNDRGHWATKAALTRHARGDAKIVGLGWVGLPRRAALPGPVIVTLVWEVTDKRRRDVGAASPTLKAAIDGFVDAGLLPADDHSIVAEERLRIEVGDRKGVRVEISEATNADQA